MNIEMDNALLAAKAGGAHLRLFTPEEDVILNAVDDPFGYPTRKTKLQDYLYYFEYNGLNYEEAYKYFKRNGDFTPGACSSVRKGTLYGRNFDWYYSNEAEFVVQSLHTDECNGSIGVAGGFSALTPETVDLSGNKKLYKMIPFQLQDGINEHGLIASYNVVSTDYGKNVALPTGTQELEINAIMLVRYILDHFAEAETAAAYIQEHCKVYFPKALHESDYEMHVMLADAEKTLILEFAANATEIIDVTEDAPYMTNFHRLNVELNADNTVFTPATQTEDDNAYDTNHISLHGAGLERFNIITAEYDDISDNATMRQLLDDLRYTKMYITAPETADPAWLTEYVGGELTVKREPEAFEEIEERAGAAYDDRDRDNPKTWQTMHAVIYDMESKMMYIRVQETDDEDMLELKNT